MPEGPEVKIITQQLRQNLINRDISEINILGGRYTKENVSGIEIYLNSHKPLNIIDINCKGKFIYFIFKDIKDQTFALWNTLGMSGSWTKGNSEIKIKHLVATISVSKDEIYYFSDVRHFGTLKFSNLLKLNQKLESLGPDILTLSETQLKRQIFSYPNKNITQFLMDQKIISGIGNYLKAEILYRSRISPHRIVSSLSNEEISSIYQNILLVSQASLKYQGVSIKDFRDLENTFGSYQNHLQVYQKSLDKNNNPIISETTLDKRTTWWCPNLQK